MADGREWRVGGHHRLSRRGQLPQQLDTDAGGLLRIVFEPVVPLEIMNPGANTESPANVSASPPDARRTMLCPGV